MKVEYVTPDEYQGDIMGDLNRRRGRIMNMEAKNFATDHSMLRCRSPRCLVTRPPFGRFQKGAASYSMEPSHFEACACPDCGGRA